MISFFYWGSYKHDPPFVVAASRHSTTGTFLLCGLLFSPVFLATAFLRSLDDHPPPLILNLHRFFLGPPVLDGTHPRLHPPFLPPGLFEFFRASYTADATTISSFNLGFLPSVPALAAFFLTYFFLNSFALEFNVSLPF